MKLLKRIQTRVQDHLPWWMKLAVVNVGACFALYAAAGCFYLPGLSVGPHGLHRFATAALLAIGGTCWYYAYGRAKFAPKDGQLRHVQQEIRVYSAQLADSDGRFIPTSGGQALAVRRFSRNVWVIGLVSSGALVRTGNETSIHALGFVVQRTFGATMCYSFPTDLAVVRHDAGSALMMRPLLDRPRVRGMSYRQIGLYLAAREYNEPSELGSFAALLRTAVDGYRTQAPDLSGAWVRCRFRRGCSLVLTA